MGHPGTLHQQICNFGLAIWPSTRQEPPEAAPIEVPVQTMSVHVYFLLKHRLPTLQSLVVFTLKFCRQNDDTCIVILLFFHKIMMNVDK